MITQENISIVLQISTFVGMIFAVYLYFKKPQIQSELNDRVYEVEFKNLKENFESKFLDMKDSVVKVMQNDLQEVKADLRGHIQAQTLTEREVSDKIARLDTKLDFVIGFLKKTPE